MIVTRMSYLIVEDAPSSHHSTCLMSFLLQVPLLLQLTQGLKEVATAAAATTELMQHDAVMSLLWTSLIILLLVCLALGTLLIKQYTNHHIVIEAATKLRLDGHAKAEMELKEKHAMEIAINEANHQGIVKGLQRSLDDSNAERRALSDRINTIAQDTAEIFSTFAGKFTTFAELQASTVAHMERFRLEVLLEISQFFSKKS